MADVAGRRGFLLLPLSSTEFYEMSLFQRPTRTLTSTLHGIAFFRLINHEFYRSDRHHGLKEKKRKEENGNRGIMEYSIGADEVGGQTLNIRRDIACPRLSGSDIATLRTYKLPYEIPCLFNRIEYISPRHERRTAEKTPCSPRTTRTRKAYCPPGSNRQPRKRARNKVVSKSSSFEIRPNLSRRTSIRTPGFVVVGRQNDAAHDRIHHGNNDIISLLAILERPER